MEKLSGLLKISLVGAAVVCLVLPPARADSDRRIVSVPALGVRGEGLPGIVNYILIQLDRTEREDGPTVQFNEVNLGGGSLVGEDWKEGVRRAVRAVSQAVGDDGHDWLITIKNRSLTAMTDGMSAGAVVAVGLMAAYRGDTIASGVALSGQITPDGRLDIVGGLPVKIEAAADARYRTVVVPHDQALTSDWGLVREVASRRMVRLVQVDTLAEAYEAMTESR